MEVTRILAKYLVNSHYEDLPEQVVEAAKRSLLNWMGCAIGGSKHEAVVRAVAAIENFAGKPQATIIGRPEKFDVMSAALINGISSHVLDFDDTHEHTLIHPSGPVMSAALAVAEWKNASGKELLHSIVLGIEAECRIGRAVYPSHYDIGWHITGTAGVFGAAAAVGRLLNLSEQQMAYALGLAATQSSGLRDMFGSMAKSFHPGRAAQSGILAATLASEGFTSSDRAIEASRGFAHVLASDRTLSKISDGLGETFEILFNTFKPFACGLVNHPAIDGAIEVCGRHGIQADTIEAISVKVHPLVLELTGIREPKTGLQGKFSIYHSVAVAATDGAAGETQYSNKRVLDDFLEQLRKRVHVETHPEISETEADVSITLKTGEIFSHHVTHAVGSLERPMSNAQIEEKVRDLSCGILSGTAVQETISACWRSDDLDYAGDILRRTVTQTGKSVTGSLLSQ